PIVLSYMRAPAGARAAEVMCLVKNNHVPARSHEQPFHTLWTLKSIDGCDDAVVVLPGFCRAIDEILTQHGKVQAEAVTEFVSPVADESGRANDEHAVRFTACHQLADDHARLNRLP